MDLAKIVNQLLLGALMLSSTTIVAVAGLALMWLRKQNTGYWLRFMLSGVALYNGLFALLLLLSLVGVRETAPGQFLFAIYVVAHLAQAGAILMFLLYLLGVLSDPTRKDA